MAIALELRRATAKIRAEQARRNAAAARQAEAERKEAESLAAKIGGDLEEYRVEKRKRELAIQEEQAERNAEAKAAAGAPENKAMPGPAQNKGLEDLTNAELAEQAAARGIEVKRADGRGDLAPTKADYLNALQGG